MHLLSLLKMMETNYCSREYSVLLTFSNGHFYIHAGVMIRGNDKNHTFNSASSEMCAMSIDISSLWDISSSINFHCFLKVDSNWFDVSYTTPAQRRLLKREKSPWLWVPWCLAEGTASTQSLGGFGQLLHPTFTESRGNCWPGACMTVASFNGGCFSSLLNPIDQPMYIVTVDFIYPNRGKISQVSRWKNDK